MKTQLTPSIDAIFVDEKTCCKALGILALKHGLAADHPYVRELQDLMYTNGCDNFAVFLVNRAA